MGAGLPQQSAARGGGQGQAAAAAAEREGGALVCARLRNRGRAAVLVARLGSGRHQLLDAGGRAQPGGHYAPGVRQRDAKEPAGAPCRGWGMVEQLAANTAARDTVL